MAEEAHKEPTMEEILASIRKIISEDDDTGSPVPAANQLRPEEIQTGDETPDEDSLSLDALAQDSRDDEMFEEFDLSDIETDSPAEAAEEPAPEEPGNGLDAAFESLADEVEEIVEEDVQDAVAPYADVVEQIESEAPAFAPVAEPEPTPEPVSRQAGPEPAPTFSAPPAASDEVPAESTMQALTEQATDNAAIGSLAKLMSRMDVGSENTLEGLVKELLKPMIKEWLDANLPAIVEDKVEAEVQRIARLAR